MLSRIALVATAFAAGVAITLIGVGYRTPTVAADEAEIAHAAAIKAQVMHTMYMLDSSGLHAIDEATAAGTVPPGSLGTVRRARIVAQATDWPDALKPAASDLVAQMKLLEVALKNENAAAAKDPAHQVHDMGHDLSDKVYAWLGGGAPADEHMHGMNDDPSDGDHDAMPGMGH
jgi:hypothetical protein